MPLTVAKDLVVTLPRKSRKDMKVTVDYDQPLAAPVEKGQTVGKIVVTAPDMAPVETPLVAAADVERMGPIGRIADGRRPLVWGTGAERPGSRDSPRGRFITIEGGEGAGKSTQAGLLVAALERAGIAAERTREPGGRPAPRRSAGYCSKATASAGTRSARRCCSTRRGATMSLA